MRRTSIGMGLAQLGGAVVLGVLAWQVPATGDTFQQAEQITREAGWQIRQAERQLQDMQAGDRKDLQKQLAAISQSVGTTLREPDYDAENLRQLRDSLSGVADGLTAMATLLDDSPAKQLGQGLGEAADYLDRQVVAAEAAAKRLEETSEMLRTDSLRLAELLRVAPLDIEAVQQVHEALGKFSAGTEALAKVLEMPQLPAIRGGLQGLETSLATGARQVEGLSSYTYPVVYWESWRPRVTQQQFWPTGSEIATGMSSAAAGVKAADKELETLGVQLPKVRIALESSKQILDRSHDTLGTVLKYRGLIEPLVKSLPETAARLAEDLPKLSKQLSASLRETQKLKAVATSLRATSVQMDKSVAAWPEARSTLLRAAEGLKANRDRLDKLLSRHTTRVQLADTAETMQTVLPIWDEQLDGALKAEQASLASLGGSLEQVAQAQAAQGATASQLFTVLRWALAVLAGVMALQGLNQLMSKRG